jgi:hypothetical protein
MKHAVTVVYSNVLLAVTFMAANAQSSPVSAVPPVTGHAYVIQTFKTESGVTLPEGKSLRELTATSMRTATNAVISSSSISLNSRDFSDPRGYHV